MVYLFGVSFPALRVEFNYVATSSAFGPLRMSGPANITLGNKDKTLSMPYTHGQS